MLKDNYDLFVEYDLEQEEESKKLPKCCECGERIDDDYLFDIEGDLYCEECIKKLYKKPMEDYMD